MRIAINHEAVYRYENPANHTIQYLRLTPQSGPTQRVLSWKLQTPGNLRPWIDAFGNAAHTMVVDGPHSEIRIRAVGEVESLAGADVMPADGEAHAPEVFLRPTAMTAVDPRVAAFAERHRAAVAAHRRNGLEAMAEDLRRVAAFRPTGFAAASPGDTLTAGTGVAQDLAHLFIACCRVLDVPARYVNGYLAGDSRNGGQAVGHAWAEAWIEGLGWLGFDVAGQYSNTQARVRLAVGLDYLDACPVRGMRRGGAGETLDVSLNGGNGQTQTQTQG